MGAAKIDLGAGFRKRRADLAEAGIVIVLDDQNPQRQSPDNPALRNRCRSLIMAAVQLKRSERRAAAEPRRSVRRNPCGRMARHVHGQSRRHPRPRHEDLAAGGAGATKAWIICACEYKGKRRQADGPQRAERQRRLDRAVLPRRGDGAGRRPPPLLLLPARAAKEFARCYGEAFGVAKPKVGEIDGRLHGERLASGGKPATIDRRRHRGVAGRRDGRGRRQRARCGERRRCRHGISAAMARPSSSAPWRAR